MPEIITERLTDGNVIVYRRLDNGTCYHKDTAPAVVNALERARAERIRVRLVLGNTSTGDSWHEEFGVFGYIGRSTGRIKIPLLLYNSRSIGGPAILDHCVIGVRYASRKKGRCDWLYRHRLYTEDE